MTLAGPISSVKDPDHSVGSQMGISQVEEEDSVSETMETEREPQVRGCPMLEQNEFYFIVPLDNKPTAAGKESLA